MIQQIDLETGLTVKEWDCSARQISKETGIDRTQINKCMAGQRKSAGGYIWKEVPQICGSSSATPLDESATPPDESATPLETRSLPLMRRIVPTPDDVRNHYKVSKETPFRMWHEMPHVTLTDKEKHYVDLTKEAIHKSDLRWKDNDNEIEGQICSYLKGGYHYRTEPSNTIPEACENLLLDLRIYDIPWEINA